LFNLPVARSGLEEGIVAVDRHLQLLPVLGLPSPAQVAPHWVIPDSARHKARDLSGTGSEGATVVGLHPGSGAQMAWKRWPAERFAQLADRLAARGAQIWLFGGPDERDLVAEVRAAMQAPARDWSGEQDLDVTAALMEQCRLMVANDSGLYNLALALPLPVVALFGPTLPGLSGPWARSSPAVVVAEQLTCRPCLDPLTPPRTLHCPIEFTCLSGIQVDHVETVCRRFLTVENPLGEAILDHEGLQAGAGGTA